MSPFTRVDLLFDKGRIERWIRFGRIVEQKVLDPHRRLVFFAPGSIFAFVRWAANAHGTIVSRIDILRAVSPEEACSSVPGVRPGGDLLLRLSGWPKVEQALASIDGVEALGIAPESACPDHWRHLHNRLSAGLAPRPYSRERHAAWLKRRKICV